jgi:hypothetical protein
MTSARNANRSITRQTEPGTASPASAAGTIPADTGQMQPPSPLVAADSRPWSAQAGPPEDTASAAAGRDLPAYFPAPYDPGAAAAACPAPDASGQMCGLFGVDIAGFTDPRRDEYVQLYLREAMYHILQRAFDGSGVPWRACQHEDRGDGALIIVPPGISVDGLADPLPERLCGLIRVHNRLSSEDARIQLRAAAHVGKVYRDNHGFAGDAANHLFRLLETPALKHLLASSRSELAFITSDYFYDTAVRRHPTLVDPAAFQPVTVDLKHATAKGWVQLIGSASSTARVLPFERSALSANANLTGKAFIS